MIDAGTGVVGTTLASAHAAASTWTRSHPESRNRAGVRCVRTGVEDAVPGRDGPSWQQSWWFRCLVVLAAIGLAVGLWRLSQPSLPDQQEAQRDVASEVGQAEHTAVTAVCTVPDSDGYTCRLRDTAGRYGYATTFFFTSDDYSGPARSYVTTRYGETAWGFPMNADGTGTMTLNAAPPGDLATSVSGALEMIGSALGRPDLLSLYGAIDCGEPADTGVTTCTVRAPVLSATVRPLDGYRYQLTYRVALPRS